MADRVIIDNAGRDETLMLGGSIMVSRAPADVAQRAAPAT
ncbi:hypothetical protein ACT691_10060 [Vibrio metschnikovii]